MTAPSLSSAVARLVVVALLLSAAVLGVARFAGSSPDASARAKTEAIPPVPRPIYIYAGACGELGQVAWPLNNLTSPDGSSAGAEDADRTEYSFTSNVPLTIDTLLGGSFAINVHESTENPDLMLACGNVGGVPDSVGTLVLGLRMQGDLDITGIAVLSPSPSDASRTLVSVFITGAALGDETGTIKPETTAIPQTPVIVENTPPVGNDPTVIVVPTQIEVEPTEIEVEPTEIEVEPTEIEDEPTEEDDDHGGGDDDESDDDNSGKDDGEDNSG